MVQLRQLAEQQLAQERDKEPVPETPEEVRSLLHDLRIHQVELEMQNEELRTTQAVLQASRDRFSNLYNFSPVSFCTLDEKGIVVECNLTLCQLLNRERRQLMGYSLGRNLPPEDIPIFQDMLSNHAPIVEERLRMRVQDGESRTLHVLLKLQRITTPIEGSGVWFAAISDITSLHLLTEDLRIKSAAIENTREGVMITQLNGKICFVNEAFEHITGYRREQVMDQNPRLLQSGRQSADFYREMWQTIEAKAHWMGEIWNRRENGEEYPVLMSISTIFDDAHNPAYYVGVFSNIAGRKQAEAELCQHRDHLEDLVAKRTEELVLSKLAAEAASHAKSAVLANMSHELRTPMNGVLGMIDLARRRITDPKGLDYLGKAKLSADRLLGVLNDILDISKIEAERMVFESIPLQLSVVVDNLTSTLGHKATEKGLQLTTDLPVEVLRPPLKGDPLRLGQILFNLVGNAIKFTDQGGVTLRVRQVGEMPEAVQMRFEVADTGIGIDTEAQTRLFHSFEQADNSMTRKYGGTGLGLAICKRLVQLMGGEIGVESTPRQGSTFWFVVPLKKQAHDAVPPAPTFAKLTAEQRLQAKYDAGTRILVAEDEPVSQEIALGMLEDVGLAVDVAQDGREALALAKQNRYALILMDMQMPVMNGVEATQVIRSDSQNQTTPILAMTANAFDEDRQVCIDAGMNDHITKPVDPGKLYETLLAWLEKRGN